MRAREVKPEERDEWIKNANARGFRKTDKATLVAHCMRKNPIRWARFKADYAYFGRVLKKLEMNPEDARFLL